MKRLRTESDRDLSSSIYLVMLLPLFIAIFFTFFPRPASAAESDWTDDFEAYSLGGLGGNGLWVDVSGTGWDVESAPVFSGSRSAGDDGGGTGDVSVLRTLYDLSAVQDVVVQVRFYLNSGGSRTNGDGFAISTSDTFSNGNTVVCGAYLLASNGVHVTGNNGSTQTSADVGVSLVNDVWYLAKIIPDWASEICELEIYGADGVTLIGSQVTDMVGQAGSSRFFLRGAGTDAFFVDDLRLGSLAPVDLNLAYSAQITEIFLPSPRNAIATTTTPTFSWEIWNSTLGAGAQSCVLKRDLIPGLQTATSECFDINVTGYQTFTETITFNDNSLYNWQIAILNEDSVAVWLSEVYQWQTGTLSEVAYTPYPELVSTTSTSTLMTEMFTGTLSFVQGIAPFSYWFQIREAILSQQSTSTLATSINFPLFTGTMTVFDSNTFETVVGTSETFDNYFSLLRDWLKIFLWAGFAFFVWELIGGLWRYKPEN